MESVVATARTCLIAMALCLVAHAATARPAAPFVGRWQWDGAETCAANYEGDNVALQIGDRKLIFYESKCDVGAVRKLGDNSYRLDLVCRGEGETERKSVIFALLAKSKVSDELLLRIEPKSGFVLAYRRCP
jgi:hypothetical protein